MGYVPRLKEKYNSEIVSKLKEEFNYSSVMQVPKLEKIAINQGAGQAIADKKFLENSLEEMSIITGQKAVPTKARKSVSNFKLREGMNIGLRVTLRGAKMYEFLDRLTSVSLPRVRDFRGINPKSFDGRGNFTLGIKEQIVFPEINIDKVSQMHGMDITFVTSADTDKEAKALLTELGLPFKK